MKYHFRVSFFLTLSMYVAIFFLFFSFSTMHIGTQDKPQEKTIMLSMSEFVPITTPPIKETKPEKVEEPEEIEPNPPESELVEEEITPEEPVIEAVKPEPTVEKVIPKPVVKKVVKKKPKKRIKKKVKKRVPKKAVVKKTRKKVKPAKRASKPQASPAKKNRFLNQLRAKINRYKTYPRIAQRRGMQGSVKVNFTILANGHVGNIMVSGKKVFYKSARTAIKKAFPISTKNAPLSLPTTVNLTLRYQIQ